MGKRNFAHLKKLTAALLSLSLMFGPAISPGLTAFAADPDTGKADNGSAIEETESESEEAEPWGKFLPVDDDAEDNEIASGGPACLANTDMTIDATDYGADGSDTADDSTALQNALKEAQNVSGTLTVNVPAGTYYINKTLSIYSDTDLILDPSATIVRTDDENVMLRSALCDSTDGAKYTRASNITIEGGTWDGNAGGTTDSNLIYICHSQNLTFKDFTIRNCCGVHHIEIAGCKDAVFDNVSFEDYVVNKNDPIDNLSGEALQFDYCDEDTSGGASPFDYTTCKNITVKNCTFTDLWSGAGSHHIDYKSSDYTFTNNTFSNMKGHCIRIPYVSTAEVKNNTADGCHVFCRVEGGSTGVTISNNTAVCDNKSGLEASTGYGIYCTDSTATISNNTLKKALNHGISAKDGGTVTVKNNTISDPAVNGINVDGSKLTASGNTITNAGSNGIALKNKTGTVSDNTVSNSGSNGIYLNASSSEITVKNNKITKSGSNGIYGSGAGAAINGNTVESSSSAGVYLADSSKSATVKNNTIKTTGTHGIGLSGAKATVSGNTVSNTATNGIYTSASTCTVSGNTLSSIGTNGISVKDKGDGTVKDNTLGTIGSHGIYVYSASASVSGNTLNKTGGHGIYGDGMSGSIKNNTVQNTESAGVYLKGSSSAPTVSGNTIKSTGTHGAAVVSGKGSIKDNKISGCGTHGIYTKDGTLTASGNTIKNCTQNGIYSDGSKVTISGNTVTGNGTNDYNMNDKSSGTLKYKCGQGAKVKNQSSKVTVTKSHSYKWKTKTQTKYGKPGKKQQVCSRCGNKKSATAISAKASSYLWPKINKTAKTSQTISWSKVSGATKYAVYGGKCGSSAKKLKETTKTSAKITGLKSGTNYKYYVVAYMNDTKLTKSYVVHGTTSGGKYGTPKAPKVKKSSISVKKGKTAEISASISSSKKVKACVSKVRYYSTNSKVASVNSKGRITGKKKGSCTVYVIAQNGKQKKVKVKIK